jgi:MoxR-like ATPase
MAERVIHLPKRRLVVELDIKVPDSNTFPTDREREPLERQMDRWFRKRMREGGQR